MAAPFFGADTTTWAVLDVPVDSPAPILTIGYILSLSRMLLMMFVTSDSVTKSEVSGISDDMFVVPVTPLTFTVRVVPLRDVFTFPTAFPVIEILPVPSHGEPSNSRRPMTIRQWGWNAYLGTPWPTVGRIHPRRPTLCIERFLYAEVVSVYAITLGAGAAVITRATAPPHRQTHVKYTVARNIIIPCACRPPRSRRSSPRPRP